MSTATVVVLIAIVWIMISLAHKPITDPEPAAHNTAAPAKQLAAEKNQAAQERALKFNQDSADKGDVYGLLRMGERYRDGDGVAKDLVKARDYLHLAALKGSDTAQKELDLIK